MPDRDLIVRLARACAHGTRQMGFVNELLAGASYVEIDHFDHVNYGDSRLSGNSWRSLKKRLVANGFIVTMGTWDKGVHHRTVEMRFSV